MLFAQKRKLNRKSTKVIEYGGANKFLVSCETQVAPMSAWWVQSWFNKFVFE